MQLDQFDFALPPELIAQFPLEQRAHSRLLLVDAVQGRMHDRSFEALPDLLSSGDVLVFNDTRVIKARLHGEKATGGKLELLVERVIDSKRALVQLRSSHPPRPGAVVKLAPGVELKVVNRSGSFCLLESGDRTDFLELLERFGSVPLPPYIDRPPSADDEVRYQTVYARTPGAVAAPTAGLHFDQDLLDRLRARGITLAYLTLHVGAGTFQPVRSPNLDQHHMHSEWYELPAQTVAAIERVRSSGGRVVAVGTTTLRALESAARSGKLQPGSEETDIFIRPGFRFRVADRLITNFHLPRSTLLVLVCAFAGVEATLAAYRHAVAQRYRFFSYGDAMLVDRNASSRMLASVQHTLGTA